MAINLNSTNIPILRTILQLVNGSVQAALPLIIQLLGNNNVISFDGTTLCLLRNISDILGGLLGGTIPGGLGGLLDGLTGGLTG